MRCRAIGWIASVLFIGTAVAAERPELGPAPAWVTNEPDETSLPKASEAPVQVLLSDQQIRITTEAVESYIASRVRIQNPQGLGALGTISFTWKPDSDVLTVHQLTATRDGKRVDLLGNGESFTILRREDQLEQAVLTGALTAVLQPPGLQVGDVIDMRYTLRRKDPVVADVPGGLYVWPNVPIVRARFRALWPDSLPLHWRASKQMPAAEPVRHDGWQELRYQMDGMVPLMQPTGAPLRFSVLRMIELTTFSGWPQMSQRLAPLYQKAAVLTANSPLRKEAVRIRQHNATPAARAAAALQLVQDQVRYVLLAMNDGGLVPATADETWQRRFGDCKAKTAMLLALLRELDIEAEPAVVSTTFGDGMDARLPAIGLFDHVLVRARIDGKFHWLDGTRTGDRSVARLQPPEFLWALPLVAKGSELVAIAREPFQEPQMVRSLTVDASAGIEIPAPFRAEMIMRGDAARGLKLAWDSVPEESRTERLRAFWREQYHGLEIEKTDTTFDDAEGVLTWKANGNIRLEWDPEYDTYEPHGLDLGYRADFTRPVGSDADAPYAVEFPMYVRTSENILLPPQTTPFKATGSDIDRTIVGVEFKRKAKVENNRFRAETTQRSIAPEFPASERTEAERVLLEMSRNNLYLKKPASYLPTREELLAQADTSLKSAADYGTRAWQMQQRGLMQQAEAAYSKALELDPKNEYSLAGRGVLRAMVGKLTLARADLQPAIDLYPKNRGARWALANVELVEGRPQETVDLLGSRASGESRPIDLLLRARAHLLLGQQEAALQDASDAIAGDSKFGQAYILKAALLRAMQREAEIPALADAALKANDNDASGVFTAISLLRLAGQDAHKRELLDNMLRQTPSSMAYSTRAKHQSSREASVADMRAAVKLDQNPPAVLYDAADLMVRRKWSRDALDFLATVEKEHGITTESANLRGMAQWQLGNKQAAAASFLEAREKASMPMLLNNICWAKATYDVALEEAMLDCDAALAKLPDCVACMDSRGFLLLRLGRLKESVQVYDAALRAQPAQSASLYGRGIALLRLGQKEAGEKDLRLADALAPLTAQMFRDYGIEK